MLRICKGRGAHIRPSLSQPQQDHSGPPRTHALASPFPQAWSTPCACMQAHAPSPSSLSHRQQHSHISALRGRGPLAQEMEKSREGKQIKKKRHEVHAPTRRCTTSRDDEAGGGGGRRRLEGDGRQATGDTHTHTTHIHIQVQLRRTPL